MKDDVSLIQYLGSRTMSPRSGPHKFMLVELHSQCRSAMGDDGKGQGVYYGDGCLSGMAWGGGIQRGEASNGECKMATTRFDPAFDVTKMKSRAIRELASAYTKLFELRLCDTQENHIAETTTVVNITIRPQCPQPSTVTISYEPCSDVNSDIQRARNAQQGTATYIAHRFLALDA